MTKTSNHGINRTRAAGPAEPSSAGATFLVVDPDPGVRRVIALILQDSGVRIVTVPDAESALDEARSRTPKVVLSEVRLPGLDGADLAYALRNEGFGATKVVLMSAYPRPPRGAEDGFLQKPLGFESLQALAEEALAEGA